MKASKRTLFNVSNETVTGMGVALLRSWLIATFDKAERDPNAPSGGTGTYRYDLA